jgi:mannose/fructose/N-acetylgalactosamine-specific phosphotransferase system component IIC
VDIGGGLQPDASTPSTVGTGFSFEGAIIAATIGGVAIGMAVKRIWSG